jgi:hypothetical protein
MDYGPHYDTRNDTERAQALPKDFGHDNPEVIRLIEVRDAIELESKAVQKQYSEFDLWRCGLLGQQQHIHNQITEIDRQRPQLLADVFAGDGDFTRDDESQQTRADLAKQLERIKLAWPLLDTSRKQLEQKSQAAHQKYSLACQAVDALLAKLRLDHVAAMRGK